MSVYEVRNGFYTGRVLTMTEHLYQEELKRQHRSKLKRVRFMNWLCDYLPDMREPYEIEFDDWKDKKDSGLLGIKRKKDKQ
jgi:hypothetical protein